MDSQRQTYDYPSGNGSEEEINQEYGINCYTLYKIEKQQRFTV